MLQLLLVIIELPLLLQAALIQLLIIQHALLLRLLSALVEKLLLRAELCDAVGRGGQSGQQQQAIEQMITFHDVLLVFY
ncbi:hypothetical protein D3C71_1933060 [compost metagenome]